MRKAKPTLPKAPQGIKRKPLKARAAATICKHILAYSLKPFPDPVENPDGTITYRLRYVSTSYIETLIGCSKSVCATIEADKLTFDHVHMFRLRLNQAGDTVTSIDVISRPDDNSYFSVAGEEDNKFVVLIVDREGGVSVKAQPSDLSDDIVDTIVGYANEAENLDDGQLLGDRYLITGLHKQGGKTTITVDPAEV